MIDWLDKHLVPEWRKAWSFLSVRAAGGFAAVITALASQPDLLLAIISFMPADPWRRAVMAVGVGAIAFFGPTVLRLWNQQKDSADG